MEPPEYSLHLVTTVIYMEQNSNNVQQNAGIELNLLQGTISSLVWST